MQDFRQRETSAKKMNQEVHFTCSTSCRFNVLFYAVSQRIVNWRAYRSVFTLSGKYALSTLSTRQYVSLASLCRSCLLFHKWFIL